MILSLLPCSKCKQQRLLPLSVPCHCLRNANLRVMPARRSSGASPQAVLVSSLALPNPPTREVALWTIASCGTLCRAPNFPDKITTQSLRGNLRGSKRRRRAHRRPSFGCFWLSRTNLVHGARLPFVAHLRCANAVQAAPILLPQARLLDSVCVMPFTR